LPSASTVHAWLNGERGAPPEFQEQYARARESGLLVLADEILEIADNASTLDTGHEVQAARLQVDARKWTLSKLLPKKFGDRLGIEGAGGEDLKIEVVTGVPRSPGDPK
jgi:hypothetical protein